MWVCNFCIIFILISENVFANNEDDGDIILRKLKKKPLRYITEALEDTAPEDTNSIAEECTVAVEDSTSITEESVLITEKGIFIEPLIEQPPKAEPLSEKPSSKESTSEELDLGEITVVEQESHEPVTVQSTSEELDLGETTIVEQESHEPVTVESTSEGLFPKCNNSLFTEEDLKAIFKNSADEMRLAVQIKEIYELKAADIRDNHLQELAEFKQQFSDRPLDLLPIIAGINTLREQLLEPIVIKAINDAKQFSVLERRYAEKEVIYRKLFKEFSRQVQICKLTCHVEQRNSGRDNCDKDDDDDYEDYIYDDQSLLDWYPDSLLRISNDVPIYQHNEYTRYCGKYNDIRNKIKSELKIFFDQEQVDFENRLIQDDDKYQEEIDDAKNKLKSLAYNYFQQTIFGIIRIEHEYGHVNVTIQNMNFKDVLDKITENVALMEPAIAKFKIRISDLARHCRKCSDDMLPRTYRGADTLNKDLLSEIIGNELQSLQKAFEEEYTTMYADLIAALEIAYSGSYLDPHKEIRERVDEAIKNQMAQLDRLKYNVTTINEDFKKISRVLNLSETILNDINENLQTIDSIMYLV